ncbi:MAG: hypothetical protein JNM17_28110 [Archangium sp.]|nr:hypothetical protein [Archangium sp.]
MKRALLPLVLLLGACVQTTGGEVVSFTAKASGDPAVVTGAPLTFTTPSGFDVTLTRARLAVGAVYLNQQNPQNYSLETSCIQEGIYSGEVRGSVLIDALSPTAVDFPVAGNGTTAPTRAAELWLTGGDVFADTDSTVVLDVAGTATGAMGSFPFEGQFTISSNRVIPPRNPALPGSNPLCRQRIVSPIAFDTALTQGAMVTLLVDPRAWFAAVDFSGLTKVSDVPLLYRFTDDQSSSAQPDKALFNALRSAVGPYRFELTP